MFSPRYAARQVFGTRRGARLFLANLIMAFGIASAIIQFVGQLLLSPIPSPGIVTLVSIGGCGLWAFIRAYPRDRVRCEYKQPDITIAIHVGDLFDQQSHIVVGFCDTFDTSTADDRVISSKSVQGQLLDRRYAGRSGRLDRELNVALSDVTPTALETRQNKPKGKLIRYPIGTVAVLGQTDRLVFALAYSRMGNDLVAQSSIDDLWASLNRLWDAVHEHGQRSCVAIPVVGAGLARIDCLDRGSLIRLILLSFMARSRRSVICRELRIVVRPSGVQKIDLLELEAFVKSL